jgi:hypothetical protein
MGEREGDWEVVGVTAPLSLALGVEEVEGQVLGVEKSWGEEEGGRVGVPREEALEQALEEVVGPPPMAAAPTLPPLAVPPREGVGREDRETLRVGLEEGLGSGLRVVRKPMEEEGESEAGGVASEEALALPLGELEREAREEEEREGEEEGVGGTLRPLEGRGVEVAEEVSWEEGGGVGVGW